MLLTEARKQREILVAEAEVIFALTKSEDRDFTEGEQGRFDRLMAGVNLLDKQHPKASQAEVEVEVVPEEPKREVPPIQPHTGGLSRTSGRKAWRTADGRIIKTYGRNDNLFTGQELPDGIRGEDLSFGRAIMASVIGDWRNAPAERAVIQASGSTNLNTSGAYGIGNPLSALWIDLARANSVLNKAGATVVPMEASTLGICRVTADGSAQNKIENVAFTDSGPTFDLATLTARTIGCYATASRELFEDMQNPEILEQTLASALAHAWDAQCLAGDGSAEILGVAYSTGVNTVTTVGEPVWDDLLMALMECEIDNCYGSNAYICSPACAYDLLAQRTGDGTNSAANYLIAPQKIGALLALTTTACPDAIAIVGDFSQAILGVRQNIMIEKTSEGGDTFKKHQIGLKITMRGDLVLARPTAFCVLSGIT